MIKKIIKKNKMNIYFTFIYLYLIKIVEKLILK